MAAAALAPPPLQRPRLLLVGTAFAAVSAAMVIIAMVGNYLLERAAVVGAGGTWLPSDANLPLTQPNVMFFGLVMSSITVQWAVSAVRNDDRINSYLALGMTFLFGLGFVNMTAYLWANSNLVVGTEPQAVLIFTVTGTHVAMMLAAMVFVALMGFRALAGGYDSRQYDGIAAAALFWHVMVAMYALIWIAVYVTK
jgi:heme/copper-type cytochrome/quinol oxidase subunit 3